jgi:integrase
MVYLAAYGALRFGELIGLRRSDIDMLHGEVIVASQLVEVGGALVRTDPKSAAGVRRVTLPPFVADELRAHLDRYVDVDPDALLFTGARGGSPSRSKWSSIWAVTRRNAGLPDTVHLHDLRHAGATLAAQAGATTKELMARLGHGSPRAALIYQHAADHRDRAIADGLQRLARPERTDVNSSGRAMDARSG